MSRTTIEEVDHALHGGHGSDEANFNTPALPTDLILKIFLHSDAKTIGRGRCMSRDWYGRLNRASNMVTHFKSFGGKAVVLHLDNPLKDADCGRLSMFVFDTRVAIPISTPIEWTWFSLVGTDFSKLCARFSIDGRSSSLITWEPLGSSRSVIADPGSDGYHYNHRDDCSAYAFLSIVGCDAYKILSLTKRNVASPGYDVQMYLSTTGRWSGPVRTPPMIERLGSGYAVASSWVFWVNCEGRFTKTPVSVVRFATMDSAWDEIKIGAGACVDHPTLIGHDDYVDVITYERSALRFGVHVMSIQVSNAGSMSWGRHLFIAVTNMTETPSLKIDRDLLGISHCVCGFDGAAASLDDVVSVAQFRSIGLNDGVVKFIGSITWPGVVCIRGCMGSGFGGYGNARLIRWAAVFNPPFQSKSIIRRINILSGITGLFSPHGPKSIAFVTVLRYSIGPHLSFDLILLQRPSLISYPIRSLASAVTRGYQVGGAMRLYHRSACAYFRRYGGTCSSPWPGPFSFCILPRASFLIGTKAKAMCALARDRRRVWASIHHSCSQVFELLDELYSLGGGRTVYCRQASNAYEVPG
ncbi:hypothetical protein AHAS_Ahas01G0208500 [Arachis hypogaea]